MGSALWATLNLLGWHDRMYTLERQTRPPRCNRPPCDATSTTSSESPIPSDVALLLSFSVKREAAILKFHQREARRLISQRVTQPRGTPITTKLCGHSKSNHNLATRSPTPITTKLCGHSNSNVSSRKNGTDGVSEDSRDAGFYFSLRADCTLTRLL